MWWYNCIQLESWQALIWSAGMPESWQENADTLEVSRLPSGDC